MRSLMLAVPVFLLASSINGTPRSTHPPDLIERVRGLVGAVIHGELTSAGETARWLADHAEPERVPTGTSLLVARVGSAATAVAKAGDIAQAATATAELFASCGGCHETAGVAPAVPHPVPPALDSIAGHMVRHQNSADLMLEGLIVPSDPAWTRGAGQLREAPLRPGDFPVSDRIGALMSAIETRLHAQAGDALSAADAPSRTRAYATLLTTCADCHTRHTTLWPQELR